MTVGTNQQELRVTVIPNDHLLIGPTSFEGGDKDMGNTLSTAVTRNTTAEHNSELQDVLKPVTHLPAAGQKESLVSIAYSDQQNLAKEDSKQYINEVPSAPIQLMESQEMKCKDQEIQCKDRDKESLEKSSYHITHEKSYFQQYLIEKGLNYQSQINSKWAETSNLENCLSMFTDLDVLDEDNKFICKACTAKKQCMYAYKLNN